MSAEAPLVLASPRETLAAVDPAATSQGVISQVKEALDREHRSLPGPVFVTPFEVLATALGRNTDLDLADAEAAVESVAQQLGEGPAKGYAIFLQGLVETRPKRRLVAGWAALCRVGDVAGLEATLERYPELLTAEARLEPERIVADALAAGDDRDGQYARARLELLDRCGTGDIVGGWTAYEGVLGRFFDEVLDPQVRHLREAFDEVVGGDKARAAEIGEELIAKAIELRMTLLEADACIQTASAYWNLVEGGAHEERSCQLLERALTILDSAGDAAPKAMQVTVLINLGAAMGARQGGDPAANMERSIQLQRRVLELLTPEDGDSWARAHTNLGLSLLNCERESVDERVRAEQDQLRAGDDTSVTEAIEHFEQALTFRRFEIDPIDWAYTQLNLALAYVRRAGSRSSNLRRAIEHNSEALRGFEAAGHVDNQAKALGNRANAQVDVARLEDTAPDERARLLVSAEEDARAAIAKIGENRRGVEIGKRWRQLGRVLAACGGYTPEVVATLRRALDVLPPQTAPRACRETGQELAELAADAGDWTVAAEAWEAAALGASAALEARATRDARFSEMWASVNVFRWAAYALIRADAPERAVEILELGRARELASWLERDLVDLESLRDANPQLCGRFVELRDRVEAAERAGASLRDAGVARASEELTSTIREIRLVPGLEAFLQRRTLIDLMSSLPVAETIAYPVTSPRGSAWLLMRSGDAHVTVVDLPSLTSTAVWEAMARVDGDAGTIEGYWVQQQITGPLLDEEIAAMAAVLGPGLLEPLARALRDAGATSVCLVTIGLLGRVPLHALSWEQDADARCLLDEVTVSYAPSAYVRQICHARAAVRAGFERLVAVGNPLPQAMPLPESQHEARLVGELVPAAEQVVLLGEAATKEAVLEAIPSASHIHLACHGHASGDSRGFDSVLILDHDRPVSAAEILELDLSRTRLVVASACETGVVPGYGTSDEVLALSTVLIGAGAAGVVASLWSVDDYATALLMVRFYEELVATPSDPARALQIASLWLRDLDPDEEARYAARHPTLERRRQSRACDGGAESYEFGYPSVWAAFVFSGA